MSREEVGMDDISKRLVHNKVCNVTVKRNKNKLLYGVTNVREACSSFSCEGNFMKSCCGYITVDDLR